MFLKLLLFSLLCASLLAKKTKSSEVVQISDIKDWKKELRTKKNVLALFTKDVKKSGSLVAVFDKVSVKMKGLATLVLVDCSEAAKLCKKLKVSPKPHIMNHYNGGEFNKVYDRKEQEDSMVLFLKDPLGDVPWSEEEAAQDIAHIDYQAFKRLLRKTELPILTMFYAPWCGHCKRMKPEFNGAATAMKGKAVLVGINADGVGGNGPQQELNVTSFPTILYFEKGEYMFKFGGERTKEGIIEWLANPTAEETKATPAEAEKSWSEEDDSPVAHLTTETFKPFLAEHSSVLVMFYAPWCGHCKSMKPEYSSSAKAMSDQNVEGRLAAVDVTENRELGDEFGVKGFPTVVYFKDGNKTFEHPSLRKEKDIVSFMKDPKEPPPPAPEEAPWSEQESSVVHLTGATFASTIKRRKHALVMFYAPWCGHCKRAKPEYTDAAADLAENNKVLLGAMDCTAEGNRETCAQYGVRGYPTIMYYTYGANAHKYSGARDRAGFVEAMSADSPTNSPQFTALAAPEEAVPELWGGETVAHVPLDQLQSYIQENSPVFLLYYRADCVTCKSVQDQFTAASTLLQYHQITFAALDCTADRTLCSTDTPHIVMHYSATRSAQYKHSLVTRDMYNYVMLVKDEL